MESEVVKHMNDPFFQDVLKEWGRHVGIGNDATAFANMFMEWMKDETSPGAAEARKACAGFVTFISARSWKEVYGTIKEAIPAEHVDAFGTPHAEDFYEVFKTIVVECVRDYWRSYLEAKRAEKEALQQQRQQQQAEGAAPETAPAAAPATAPATAPAPVSGPPPEPAPVVETPERASA